ncbi:glycogen synthase GlgA [Anaerovorax odorimutans]|uniref:glycogen synthase GlgA n=1 Tax=Anaerovorax odorimutans TaxID=109327 RepID=UPI0003F8DD34|nr:glycogen synthase GlgA [Anaerovorax odorimutans]
MRILFLSTEADPFAKSGGLGDVIGSLPRELKDQGIDARVMLPLYKSIKQKYIKDMKFISDFSVDLAWRNIYCGLFEIEYDGVTFYFLDNEYYFYRDNYYGYFDDGERFAYFSKAVLSSLGVLDFKPEILHCNEWQTALIPVYLKTLLKDDPNYNTIKTVFTIHNIEYQGRFDKNLLSDILGLSEEFRNLITYNNDINFMKGAIVTCDKLTTVSPTYAEEITYSFYGRGLEEIIKENQYKLKGILNGIDTKLYDPEKDKTLAANYAINNSKNKEMNKKDLQKNLGLKIDSSIPIFAIVGRMVEHKGIDMIINIFEELMNEKIQVVVLGTGMKEYEDFFKKKAYDYGDRMNTVIGFSSELATKIYAGSDFFLMPSISEPCGLAQMIALRYGTIPIVRETGGLKDSISAFSPENGIGNGITFKSINSQDLLGAVKRAIKFYWNKDNWHVLIKNALKSDFSWKQSTKEYMSMYEEIY